MAKEVILKQRIDALDADALREALFHEMRVVKGHCKSYAGGTLTQKNRETLKQWQRTSRALEMLIRTAELTQKLKRK